MIEEAIEQYYVQQDENGMLLFLGCICCKAANTDTCFRDYFFPEAGVF